MVIKGIMIWGIKYGMVGFIDDIMYNMYFQFKGGIYAI